MDRKEKILELRRACYECRDCPLGRRLVEGLDPHVFAAGNVRSKIVFIAEAPGANEVVAKTPLIGRAGKFFDKKILEVAGIRREKIYITNTVLCRPNEKNRNPLPAEIEECRQHLDAQVCLVDPVLLVVFGNVPLGGVCETYGITKKRGKLIWSREWSNGKKYPTLPMFHPSYNIRGSGLKETQIDAEYLGRLANDIRNGETNWEVEEANSYQL